MANPMAYFPKLASANGVLTVLVKGPCSRHLCAGALRPQMLL
jgi:hypothetical protein